MKDSIVIFRDQLEALAALTSVKDVKTIVQAIIDYGMNGKEVDSTIPEHLRFGWKAFKHPFENSVSNNVANGYQNATKTLANGVAK